MCERCETTYIWHQLGRLIVILAVGAGIAFAVSKSVSAHLPPTPSRVGLGIDALFSSELPNDCLFRFGDKHGVDALAPALHGQAALFALGVEGSDFLSGHRALVMSGPHCSAKDGAERTVTACSGEALTPGESRMDERARVAGNYKPLSLPQVRL